MITRAEASQRIHDHEFLANGMQHLNGADVSVRNLKRVKGGFKADIILSFEDKQERYDDCTYYDADFNKFLRWK
jgi:hypothetical protein